MASVRLSAAVPAGTAVARKNAAASICFAISLLHSALYTD